MNFETPKSASSDSGNIDSSTKENVDNESKEQNIEDIIKELAGAIKKRNQVLARRMRRELSGIEVDREDEKVNAIINRLDKARNSLAINEKEFHGLENNRESKIIEGNIENVPVYSREDELNYKDKIRGEDNFRDLLRRVSEQGDLIAPDGYVYTKKMIIDAINKVSVEGESSLNYVTRTAGLRDKVKELLIKRELDSAYANTEEGKLEVERRKRIQSDAIEKASELAKKF